MKNEKKAGELTTVELIAPIRRGLVMHLAGEKIDVHPHQAKWLEVQGKAKPV